VSLDDVINGLKQQAEYWEYRYGKDIRDRKGQDLFFMNVSAEAAAIIMELKEAEDDGK